MKWTWIYIALGGSFIIKLIESSRTIALINEAKQLKEVTKKPIMLISSNPRQGFDVYLNPNETITWQLPYMNKAFASIVSDALEEIPYPKQAMTEWMRVADTVLVNTHSIFSPEAWLDFRHHYVFMGQQTIPVSPTTNWAIAGGVGYFLYRRRKRLGNGKVLPEAEEPEVFPIKIPLPPLQRGNINQQSTIDNPRAINNQQSTIPKALPPPKVEPAPIYHPSGGLGGVRISPEEFMGTIPPQSSIFNLPSSIKKGSVNLSIGLDETLNTELKEKGIENLTFDPQHLPEEQNRQVLSQLESKPADTATLFGILDKVTDSEERKSALQVAYENIKLGGKVFVKVEEPKKYLPEIRRIFPSAKIREGMITAVK